MVTQDSVLSLQQIETRVADSNLPPVDQWHPERSAEIDMIIKVDGSWWYQGSLIRRSRMVRLFSTILRLDRDGRYCLVTPVEKLYISVEDSPFIATSMSLFDTGTAQSTVAFETNVEDTVILDAQHSLKVLTDEQGNPRPYVHVRDGLQALLSRSVYYELVEACTLKGNTLGIMSRGMFHVMGKVDDGDQALSPPADGIA